VRELGYRDLGGLVFDQHRFARPNEELVRGKVAALAAVDAELRALEDALGDRRAIVELREPGITACPRCGTLHASEARFCPSCGLALGGARTIAADVGEGAHIARPSLAAAGSAPQRPEPQPSDPHPAEPQPASEQVAEREAAKSESDNGRDRADQKTAIARPAPDRKP
jgi:zinc ribbon protein